MTSFMASINLHDTVCKNGCKELIHVQACFVSFVLVKLKTLTLGLVLEMIMFVHSYCLNLFKVSKSIKTLDDTLQKRKEILF